MSIIGDITGSGAVATAVSSVFTSLLDKIFPDPTARAQAQVALLQAQEAGKLEELKIQMSAIIAEANSTDPLTSRARPTFLYVIYVMLLMGIPMGILSAWSPETAQAIAVGFGAWLKAIPDGLYALFGAGYLGYTGARMQEKKAGAA